MMKLNGFVVVLIIVALCAASALAAATVTPATGGDSIDNSTAGVSFTNLTGPVISESTSMDIGNGTIILNAPSGFEFDTAASVTVLVTRTAGGGAPSRNINDAASGTSLAVTSITSSTITFTVTDTTNATFPPGPAAVTNSLTWQGVRVRPTAALPLASGNITKSGTSAGVSDGTAMGELIEITIDTTPPVVTVPSDMIEEATGASGATVVFSASALDDVDGSITPTCAPVSGSTFALGTTPVNCSATDSSGNTGSDTFDITVQDTTDPILTVPADITTEAVAPFGAIVDYMPSVSATDLVDASPSIFCAPPGGPFPIGTTTVNCTATDDYGNSDIDSFDVIVEDTTPPVLSGMPSDIVTEATSPAGAVVVFTDPTASDIVDGPVVPSCVPASGSTFPLGITTVTCTATDAASNSDSDTFDITVSDTTPPSITAPGDVSVEATGPTTVVPLGSPIVSDTVDPSPSVSNDAPGAFSVGITTVTWTATDASSNSAFDTQDVTVTDTTPPIITLLGSSPVIVTLGDPYVDDGATAADLVDGDLTGSISAVSTVDTGTVGSYTVTYDVTDAAGNPAVTVIRDVDVVAAPDTTAPVITMLGSSPIDIEVGTAYVDDGATALDDVDGDITGSIIVTSTVDTSILGTYTVDYDVTDSSGNPATTVTRTVNVVDTTPPVITLIGGSVAVTLGDVYVDAGATAADFVDGNLTGSIVIVNPVNTSVVGTYNVTYDVTDSSGNPAATVTRTVTVASPPAPASSSGGGGGGGGGSGRGGYSFFYNTNEQGTVPTIPVAQDTTPPQSSQEEETVVEPPVPVETVQETVPAPEPFVPQATGVFGLGNNPLTFIGLLLAILVLIAIGIWAFRKK